MRNQKYSPVPLSQNHMLFSNNTLGISRNRTSLFFTFRESILNDNPKRDKKVLNESCLTENGKTSLLGQNDLQPIDSSTNNMIELLDISQSKTLYMDIFNSTNVLYEELKINSIVAQLQQEQQNRIMPKFDDEENSAIDRTIKEMIITMTAKVKKCEDNIKQIGSIRLESSNEMRIKDNMKINLAEKIKDFTHEFRLNEEKYMRNYKDLVGDTDNDNMIEVSLEKPSYEQTGDNSGSNFLQDTVDFSLRKRDAEITTLLTSITELAQTFTDLQILVQEQGTILDRIDYNIETALTSTQDAHKSLVKANENMKQNCFRNAIMILFIIIFVLAVLLLLKFTN